MTGQKLVLTVAAGDHAGGDAAEWILAAASSLPTDGCVVNLVREPVTGARLPTPDAPPLAAVVEMWTTDVTDPEAAVAVFGGAGAVGCYVVDEVVQRHHLRPAGGGPTPGIRGIYLVGRRPGLALDAFARHWREVHGPLALQIHVGMSGYVQNVVRDRLGAAAADVDGIAALHFPSVRGVVEGMYDSQEAAKTIGADVARFVGASHGYPTVEHVVRAPAASR